MYCMYSSIRNTTFRKGPRSFVTSVTLATSAISPPSSAVGKAAASLLPPVPLYRQLLRAHRQRLSAEMRSLGDAYVKDEFRRHRNVENPLQLIGFLAQWKKYLDLLKSGDINASDENSQDTSQGSNRWFRGKRLDINQFEKLSDAQVYQLHELLQATRELYNGGSAGDNDGNGSSNDSSHGTRE